MKFVSKWSLRGLLLAALLAVTPPIAVGQGQTTLTVYDPTGAFDVTQMFAPRAADLNNKTICEVSNGGWQAGDMFPYIRSLLQEQFPTSSFVSFDNFPVGIMEIDTDKIGELVKAAGCDAAIVGNAA